jgi:hypothetical protein
MTRTSILCSLLACILVLAAPGCYSPDADRRAYVATPPDLSLSITVIAPDRALDQPPAGYVLEQIPERDRSSRIIVEPDGSLRIATGPGATVDLYPSRIRLLSRNQMLDLWRTCRNLGLIDAEPTHGISNPTLVKPQPGRTIFVISIHALGDRVTIAVDATERTRIGEGGRRLINQIYDYAWLDRS